MFLEKLQNQNPNLIKHVFDLHAKGEILPNTYVIDLDKICENAQNIKNEADKYNIELYFMTKQLGRNPVVCKKLMDIGYKGAVVVDFQEAKVMMDNNIPIAHIGHLVQIPTAMLEQIILYNVGMITVFSLEIAEKLNQLAKKHGKTQNICLKFYDDDDFMYQGQQAGFHISSVETIMSQLKKLTNLSVVSLTAFPCFLYDPETKNVGTTCNMQTMKKAQKHIEKIIGKKLKLNMPSCNQVATMQEVYNQGGTSAEPGSALIGMTPNQTTSLETPAMVYYTQISHNFKANASCYGGGSYPRGAIDFALVGETLKTAKKIKMLEHDHQNIDYHLQLKYNAEVGHCVLMNFRTQVFITRSYVAVVSGISTDAPQIVGTYLSSGYELT